jgi:N-acetylglutamate synthase-like GNAT family acetyltransferase
MQLGFFGRHNPDMTLESRAEQLRARIGKESIPMTVVALDQEKPIGSACLVEQDLDLRPELTPWVASVFVHSDYRRKGVGTALMNRLESEAAKLGIKKLYLFTPDRVDFYTTLDWKIFGREKHRNNEVTLMEKAIAPQSGTD